VEDHDQTIETQEDTASSSNSDACTNSSEHGEEGFSLEKRVDYEDKFGEAGGIGRTTRDPTTNLAGTGE